VNSKVAAVQTAAQVFTDTLSTVWQSTAAASSDPSVVATSSSTAATGATTFNVLALATAQVSTIAADSSGNVVTDPTQGITITGADGTTHAVSLTSGSASDVAAAINKANVGVRASVVNVDNGSGGTAPVLQLSATTTGTKAAFTVSAAGGLQNPVQTVVGAANAQVGVGTPGSGGYTVSSQSNTFTNVIPGVTFSVSALASNVTVGVRSDAPTIASKIQDIVDSLNAATGIIGQATAKGAVLQGSYDVTSLQQTLYSAISNGANSVSLHSFGIDMDSTGKVTFDSGAFTTAYMNDPTGTQSAINAFAASLNTSTTSAVDPTTGTITAAITSATSQSADLNSKIDDWTSRLADIQTGLQQKYANMQAVLAKLQGQSTYLTSMLKNLNGSSSSSGN
jgi:flagellar hook-associated protein 2